MIKIITLYKAPCINLNGCLLLYVYAYSILYIYCMYVLYMRSVE